MGRFGKRHLVNECNILRGDVLSRGLAREEEIEEVWPDGGERRGSWEEWIRCHSNLVAFRRREEWAASNSEHAEDIVLDIIRDEPKQVPLLDGRVVSVYPKSLNALLWFRARDWALHYMSVRLRALYDATETGTLTREDLDGIGPDELSDRVAAAIQWELQAICEEACYPHANLSPRRLSREANGYPRYSEADPTEDFSSIDPADLYRLNEAFQWVNGGRLAYLEVVAPTRGASGERLSWNVFYGMLSKKLKIPARELAHDHSLINLLGSSRLGVGDTDEELEEALQ